MTESEDCGIHNPMTNTAQQLDVFVGVDELNQLPLAHVFRATAPARVVAERVTCGQVEVFDKPGEEWWLVRIDGHATVLKPTEVVALEASTPQVLRHLSRISHNRHLGEVEAKERRERAARIAACPGHELVEHEIARCLRWVGCKHCGLGGTVSSDD